MKSENKGNYNFNSKIHLEDRKVGLRIHCLENEDVSKLTKGLQEQTTN